MAGITKENWHRMSGKPEYKTWEMMVQRCTNPRYDNYSYYGGRGITVCSEWLAFKNFYKDMGTRPKGRTLDRIDVDGNYNKYNCRWASKTQQSINKRTNKSNTSGCKGVNWHRAAKKWVASVTISGKQHYLGCFEDWFDAVCARKSGEILYYKTP